MDDCRRAPLTSVFVALALASVAWTTNPARAQAQDVRPWASDDSWLEVQLEAVSSDDLLFSSIVDLAFNPRGAIYVNDWRLPEVVVLDSLLAPVTTIGRYGEGPGEFELKSNLQFLQGDSLLVFDASLGRMTVFPEARPDTSRITPVARAGVFTRLWRLQGPSPRHLALSVPTYYASDDAEADQDRTDVFSVLDASAQAVEIDSVLVVPSGDVLVLRAPGRVALSEHPYAREGFVGMLHDGFTYVHSGSFSVTVFDARENLATSFSYPTIPLPVPSEHMDSVLEGRSRAEARMLRRGAPYTWPPVVGLVVDDRDRIWIGLRGQPTEAHWEWAAFTPAGRHVGSVRLPAGHRVHAAAANKLLAVAIDELDVPTIHLYRIREAG